MYSPLYPNAMIKSLNPKREYIFIICQRICLSPILTIGFSLNSISSLSIVEGQAGQRLQKSPEYTDHDFSLTAWFDGIYAQKIT